jgi:hypothetical protein
VIDFEKHFQILQHALDVRNACGKNCIDKIDEQLWRDEVMEVLNEISFDAANELQKETGKPYPKDSYLVDGNGNFIPGTLTRDNQKYSEQPPTRLLSMTLVLSYWLGFHDTDKGHQLQKEGEGGIGAWDRIEKTYKSGFAANSSSRNVTGLN